MPAYRPDMPSIALTPGPYRPRRRWFAKKRYAVPLALFATLLVIGSLSPEQAAPPTSPNNPRTFAAAGIDEEKKAADAAAAKKAADAAAAKKAADAAAAKKAAEAEAARRAAEAAAAQQAAAAAAAPVGAQSFDNCTHLQTVYPHGVGMPGAVDSTSGTPVTTFERSAALYQANSGSDRDDDNIACEKK
jgi:hypothetical protein